MKKRKNEIFFKVVLTFCLLLVTASTFAQYAVRGTVIDENNKPLANVDIYVKFSEDTPYKTDENGHFELRFQPGEVYLIFDLWGYQQKEVFVPVSARDQTITVQLLPSFQDDLQDIVITAKKSNVGREVIKKVVAHRSKISPWNYAHKADVYIKTIDKNPLKISDDKKNKNEETFVEDPFDEGKAPGQNGTNFLEIKLQQNYAPGGKIKEYRNAYTLRGTDQNMYYKTTVRSDFNFFENTLLLPDLQQNGIISPVSSPGILAYKYKLEDKYKEGNQTIYKIKISPRKISSSTLEGYIYVVDSLFILQKVDLRMTKGNLLKYDYFSVYQEYGFYHDSINFLKYQAFDYGAKYGKDVRKIHTSVYFSNYDFHPEFAKKLFNSEVAVTKEAAYERDSSYWKTQREVQLTPEEARLIQYSDSVKMAHSKQAYLDSVDKEFNRVTALKVLWYGVDMRNRAKQTQWTFNPLIMVLRPIYIAGPRIAPGAYFFKKWKDERYLDLYGEASYGFLNQDVKGRLTSGYRYNPFKSGFVRLSFYQDFDALRSYDAITQIYKRSNFIEVTGMKVTHEYEWFNGFYSTLTYEFAERRPLTGYKFVNWLDKALNNDLPTDFKTYQAGVAGLQISYTPFQKYMREPHRKVILGSKWPIFYAYYERGIPQLFGSDVNYDYLLVGIRQQISLNSAGTLSYHLKSGEFLSHKSLYDADKKYLRRSDPIWLSNPMYSFQHLDTLIPTIQRIIELHVLYHDNGSVINKIPFMKKTRIGLVAGTGFAYFKEGDWWHGEVLVGLERNFRLSRRLLRIGIYYAMSYGKHEKISHTGKISFSILDDRTMKYNF